MSAVEETDVRERSSSVTRVRIEATSYSEGIGNVEQGRVSQTGKIGPLAVTGYEANQFTGRPLVIVTVGLPGRGKSYVSRRLARFLSWLGLETCIFQVHGYRRNMQDNGSKEGTPQDYFNHENETYVKQRDKCVCSAISDMVAWLRQGGKVGILDGQNVQQARREMILEKLSTVLDQDRILFLEVGETNQERLLQYKEMTLTSSSSFRGLVREEASTEFDTRMRYYRAAYEPLTDDVPYIRMLDGGSDLEMNLIHGYVPCRVANFLLNVNLSMKPIFLSRHGQSEFNSLGRIGGDPGLTPFGERYAEELAEWLKNNAPDGIEVWCSTLLRTRMTATPLSGHFPVVYWRALEEIDAGVYDGLTYEEIKETAAEEYSKRQENKYWYRYPHGESYHDLVARLDPVIMELERSKRPLLIVSHQATLRVIYAYLVDAKPELCTNLSMPLHTVVKVSPTYGGEFVEERFPITEMDKDEADVGTHGKEDLKKEEPVGIGRAAVDKIPVGITK